MDRELLEGLLGEGMSLAAIGRRVGRHESTVAYWVELYGLRAVGADRYSARGGIARDELLALIEEGMSIAQIAIAVDRSKTTVRHWLRRYGLKTWSPSGARRAAESEAARVAGLRETTMACARHGDADFVVDGRGYYRCRKCRSEAVSRRRRKMKEILVAEAGGACCRCGYSRTMRALHFHHLDPAEKRLELNARGVALSLDTLRAEARKCVLLCSNCHAEVEEGALLELQI
jgi:transposase